MSKIKASLLRFSTVAVLSALLFGSGAAARAEDLVRIGVGIDPAYTAWWVADAEGLYKKYNLKAEITQFQGGPDLADATMAGEEDIGASGTATWMPRLVRANAPIIVSGMATSDHNYRMAALTSITSLEQLKGQKVGTVAGSTTDYLWALFAKKLGIPESGIDIVPVPPPELVAALDRHDISAFISWEPWPSKAVEISGPKAVHILATSGDLAYFQSFIVCANRDFAAAKPDVVVRVVAAMRDAIDFMSAHHDEAVKISAEKNKLTPALTGYIVDMYQWGIAFEPEIRTHAQTEEMWMRGKDRLKGAPIDWNKAVDSKFVDQALAMK